MKYTNKHNLPRAFYEAIIYDSYNKGECDYSTTQLLKPPYMCKLEREHDGELERDITELIKSKLGTAMHNLLEKGVKTSGADGDFSAETRLYHKFDDIILGGQIDVYDIVNKELIDYKVTSIWSIIFGKKDWERQQNINRLLCEYNGINVEQLTIVATGSDWQRGRAKRERD